MRALRNSILAAACLAASMPVSAQTCPAIPIGCLQPAPLAQANGARFAWGALEGDAWVARFERGATEPSWRVVLGGSGSDSVATVTLSRGGAELLVAGATTSPALTGFAGRNSGGRDGFVARLDAANGRLLSGVFVGGAGDEELSGVVADRAGNILVSGIGASAGFGTVPAAVSVVEPTSASGDGSPVFLSTLDASLAREQSRFALGKIRVKKPRIWIDCNGNVVVGVVSLSSTGCNGSWPDLVYEQDQIAEDYDIDHDWMDMTGNLGYPPGGWGYHALRWKEYHANDQLPPLDPPYILDWALGPPANIPKTSTPGCFEGGTLNQLETQIYLKNSVVTDPPGGWVCGNHADFAQLALYAAHFFYRWGTPVYTQLGNWDNLNGPWVWQTHPVGLERVTFEPFCPFDPNGYSGETLDDLCDLGVDNVANLTCTSSTGIPGVSGGSFYLRFKELEGAKWGLQLVWWLRPVTWDRNFTWWYDEWYEPGEYLMDPPPGSANEVAILQEAARQSADQVMRPGTVQVTRLAKGVPTCKQTVEALFPASE